MDTYTRVGQYWESKDFQVEDIVESQGNVAVFGRFTYESRTLAKTIAEPVVPEAASQCSSPKKQSWIFRRCKSEAIVRSST